MSARRRVGVSLAAVAVAAGVLAGCGSKGNPTPAATPSSATTLPVTLPTVPAAQATIDAAQSALDPFVTGGGGGGKGGSGRATSATTTAGSGGGSTATTAASGGGTGSATTTAPTTGTTTGSSTSTTVAPGGTTTTTTRPTSPTTLTLTDRYVAWYLGTQQPDLSELNQTVRLISKDFIFRRKGGGTGPMHRDGARLVAQAVGMEAKAGPPITSIAPAWHDVLHSYVAYGRSVRSLQKVPVLVKDLRGIVAALKAFDKVAHAAGVGPAS